MSLLAHLVSTMTLPSSRGSSRIRWPCIASSSGCGVGITPCRSCAAQLADESSIPAAWCKSPGIAGYGKSTAISCQLNQTVPEKMHCPQPHQA